MRHPCLFSGPDGSRWRVVVFVLAAMALVVAVVGLVVFARRQDNAY